MTARAHSDAGFTLVEALVALFVFSLISAGCVAMLIGSVRAQADLDARQASLRDIQITQSMMAADLAQIAPRTIREGGERRTPRFLGGMETAALAFARANADPDDASGAQSQVVYVTYVIRDGALIRRSRASLDPTPQSPVSERTLIRALSDAKMRFFDGARWIDAWPGGTALPRAVAFEGSVAGRGPIRIAAFVGATP